MFPVIYDFGDINIFGFHSIPLSIPMVSCLWLHSILAIIFSIRI